MDIQSLLRVQSQLAQQEAQRKALMARLDDPQVRTQLRGQLDVALGQIDVLATQLDAHRETVALARARVEKVIAKLDKAPSLSELVNAHLERAAASMQEINESVLGTSRAASKSTPTRKKNA